MGQMKMPEARVVHVWRRRELHRGAEDVELARHRQAELGASGLDFLHGELTWRSDPTRKRRVSHRGERLPTQSVNEALSKMADASHVIFHSCSLAAEKVASFYEAPSLNRMQAQKP